MEPCREWQTRLTAWFDGETSELDAAEVRAHLLDCGGCRATATRWKRLSADLELLQPSGPAPADLDRMARRFEEGVAGELRRLSAAMRFWNLAAALLLLAALGFATADRLFLPATARADRPRDIERALQQLIERPVVFPAADTPSADAEVRRFGGEGGGDDAGDAEDDG